MGSRLARAVPLEASFVPIVLAIIVVWLATTERVFLSSGNLRNVLNQMVILAIGPSVAPS